MGDALVHFGVKGMQWGVRRYQNEDGSLTPKGIKRSEKLDKKADQKWMKRANSQKSKDSLMKDLENDPDVQRRTAVELRKILKMKVSDVVKTDIYTETVADVLNSVMAEKHIGYSPSGKKRVGIGVYRYGGTSVMRPDLYELE